MKREASRALERGFGCAHPATYTPVCFNDTGAVELRQIQAKKVKRNSDTGSRTPGW